MTAARRVLDRGLRRLRQARVGRPFTGDGAIRLLVLFEDQAISYSQVHPFVAHGDTFARRHDAEIRLMPVTRALAQGLSPGHRRATHVAFQTWLTDPPEKLDGALALLDRLPDLRRVAYLDSFANTDIRFAKRLGAVDLYYKKSLFADPERFLRPTRGDTNLADYYGPLFGLDQPIIDWEVPRPFLSRLRLAPNFLTAPALMQALLRAPRLTPQTDRDIDLHARIGGTGRGGWYGAMRRHAQRRVDSLAGLRVATGGRVPPPAFLAEMRRARVCFSPFGYGELCWRDIEAITQGAVLLKPDMSHLRSLPDLFRPDETYVACRWDLSDLPDRLHELLADDARRQRISDAARAMARAYLARNGPVDSYRDLFAP